MKTQDDEVFNDFEHCLSWLMELRKKLSTEPDTLKRLKFFVYAEAALHKHVLEYRIDIKTIEKYHKYEKEFSSISTPSSCRSAYSVNIKPIFNPDYIPVIFDYLKCFFSPVHQKIFFNLLKKGGDSDEPLIFLDNGNRLADSFKQLYDCEIITGCDKKELEGWISRNFMYKHRRSIVSFRPKYLNTIISTNNDTCRNPVLNVLKEKLTGSFVIRKA